MRVGLLIYGSLETISGGYLYDRKLVQHLRDQGDQVEIISIPWRSYPRHLLDNFSRSLLEKIQSLKVDVLIQDELNHPSLFSLNSRVQVPYPIITLVHHLRCVEPHAGWQKAVYHVIERHYLDGVDGFIFNSQTTKQSVARTTPIDNRTWVVATPAGDRFDVQIHADEIAGRAQQMGPLKLIFLGNLIPRKGLHTLLEALGKLESGCCRLDVIGDFDVDPGYTERVLKQAERLGLLGNVRFLGVLDDDILKNQIKNCQLLVVPSSYEGFGIVYLEAMGFGLPGIATTRGGAGEIIRHGETGYLIEPGDAQNLAHILGNLAHDRQTLTQLSLNARQDYLRFPVWEQSMAKVRRFLREIVAEWT